MFKPANITIIILLTVLCFGINQVYSQQKNIDEILKQINFKLKVVNSMEGKWVVEANDDGDILIKQTLSDGLELRYGLTMYDVRMEVKPIENASLFALYFRCKEGNCVRFENDNGLVRMDNFSTLFTKKQVEAEDLMKLFAKLKTYTKKT